MLVEDPPASQDPAGVNLPPVELLQHGGTVLSRFKRLTGKVPFNIEMDLVRIPTGLEEKRGNREKRNGLDGKRKDLLREFGCNERVCGERDLKRISSSLRPGVIVDFRG